MRDLNLCKKSDRERKEEILTEIEYAKNNTDFSTHKKNNIRRIGGPVEEPFMKIDFKDDKLQVPRKIKKKFQKLKLKK